MKTYIIASMDTGLFILITDIIGTVAFAVSGAMAGIRKKMDIFGVYILALLTATGGGIIRDLVMGSTPPAAFRNPFFVIIAAIAANITFIFVWWQHKNKKNVSDKTRAIYDKIFFWFDTVGLAAFTADGVHTGLLGSHASNAFLVIFLGVVTGVGGGVLRDVRLHRRSRSSLYRLQCHGFTRSRNARRLLLRLRHQILRRTLRLEPAEGI